MLLMIILPLPERTLSPNDRSHWAVKMREKKLYRDTARRKAENVLKGWRPLWKAATIQYCFYFAIKRKRDDDNLIAMMKSARDGLADAGIVADDCGFTTLPVERRKDKNRPRVEVYIDGGK